MAKHKKKKSRKTRAQKLQKAQVVTKSTVIKELPRNKQSLTDSTTKATIPEETQQSSEDMKRAIYVKNDIKHSLILMSVIIVSFALIWILLEKTAVGNVITQIKL